MGHKTPAFREMLFLFSMQYQSKLWSIRKKLFARQINRPLLASFILREIIKRNHKTNTSKKHKHTNQ